MNVHGWIDDRMNKRRMNVLWMSRWQDELKKDEYMKGWIKGRLNGLRMSRLQNGLTEKWMDHEWIDGWMDLILNYWVLNISLGI